MLVHLSIRTKHAMTMIATSVVALEWNVEVTSESASLVSMEQKTRVCWNKQMISVTLPLLYRRRHQGVVQHLRLCQSFFQSFRYYQLCDQLHLLIELYAEALSYMLKPDVETSKLLSAGTCCVAD